MDGPTHFTSLDDLTARVGALGTAPVLMVVCEDGVEVASTLEHHLGEAGFRQIVLAVPPGVAAPDPLPAGVHLLTLPRRPADMAATCVTALARGRPDGAWTAWCHNAEYLFTPFMESRTVGEAMAFCSEERRDAILTFTVDLYGRRMGSASVVDRGDAWLDETGYYALLRHDRATDEWPERQMDFFGGLRWRFEEHVPEGRRRIDRVAMFRARPGLELRPDFTVNVPEMNTYACPWHHSLTACTASFRAAKGLAANPGSREVVETLHWDGSVRFDWRAQQLLDLGLMEPGQWF
jgi:hypothetical protein